MSGNNKRYVATIEVYVYAESETEAKKHAEHYVHYLDSLHDNRAKVIDLKKQDFGKIG